MTLQNGTRVRTIKPAVEPPGYEDGARANNQWDITGVILRHSGGHGLCYEVRHPDGTVGWYEPIELEIVLPNQPNVPPNLPDTKEKRSCARGRVSIEHALAGHYELRIVQTRGHGAPCDAGVCLTEAELQEVATMIGRMFPAREECDFGDVRLESDEPSHEGTD